MAIKPWLLSVRRWFFRPKNLAYPVAHAPLYRAMRQLLLTQNATLALAVSVVRHTGLLVRSELIERLEKAD